MARRCRVGDESAGGDHLSVARTGGIVAIMAVDALGLRGPNWWFGLLGGVAMMTVVAVFLFGWIENLSAARPARLLPRPRRHPADAGCSRSG